jgi:hypothetical protein
VEATEEGASTRGLVRTVKHEMASGERPEVRAT